MESLDLGSREQTFWEDLWKVQARHSTQNLAVEIRLKCTENDKGFKVLGAKIQQVVCLTQFRESRCEA